MKNLKEFQQFAKGHATIEKRNSMCVIYTRVSTKEQAENNMSLETQRKACETYSKKNGFRIMAYFGGTYESAKTDERTEFNNMLSFVRKSRDQISHIIVFSVDRFSRSGANAIYITEQLKKQGVNVISVMQPTDVSTPSGSLQQNIQFIFSEYDNQLRREKCITGMRNKFLKGEWCMKPPRGYDIITINGRRSIVVNPEGKLLRKAFVWKYYEKISQKEIADRLAAMGLIISAQRMSHLFRNPFYCGIIATRSLQGKVVNGKHEKLVSKELFLEINSDLSNARHNSTHIADHPELPLRRVLKCFKCGTSYTGYLVKKKNLYYYKCSKIGCCCNRNNTKIHDMFLNLLSKVKIDEAKYPTLKKEFASNFIKIRDIGKQNIPAIKGNLTIIKSKIEFLEKRYVFKEIGLVLYKKHLAQLKKEQEEVETQLDKLRAGLFSNDQLEQARNDIMKNLTHLWSTGSLQVKRLIQTAIFPEGICFDKPNDRLLVKKLAPGFVFQSTIDSEESVLPEYTNH